MIDFQRLHQRRNYSAVNQIAGVFVHGKILRFQKMGTAPAVPKQTQNKKMSAKRPSKVPSFVYRQDGYELSYKIRQLLYRIVKEKSRTKSLVFLGKPWYDTQRKGVNNMIDFQRLHFQQREDYEKILFSVPSRGCEYSFANLYLWGSQQVAFLHGCVAFFSHFSGRSVYPYPIGNGDKSRGCEYSFANLYLWGSQQVAFLHGCVAFFSHFSGRSVYPYPIGNGDKRVVLELILQDAKERGIPCRITNVLEEDRKELESWFPGKFLFHTNRDSFDYLYAVQDLAELKGRKFQKKRNHVNRFLAEHPNYRVEPLNCQTLGPAQCMVNDWYTKRIQEDPHGDYLLENLAMARAFRVYEGLGMESLVNGISGAAGRG